MRKTVRKRSENETRRRRARRAIGAGGPQRVNATSGCPRTVLAHIREYVRRHPRTVQDGERASERERRRGGGRVRPSERKKTSRRGGGRVEALTEKSRRGFPFRPLRRVRPLRRLWLRRQRHVPTQVDGVFTEEQPHHKRRRVALPNPRRSQQTQRPASPSPKLVDRRHARERRRMPREERERGDAQLVPRVHERAEQRGGDVSAEANAVGRPLQPLGSRVKSSAGRSSTTKRLV